jgi:hypothetical protein
LRDSYGKKEERSDKLLMDGSILCWLLFIFGHVINFRKNKNVNPRREKHRRRSNGFALFLKLKGNNLGAMNLRLDIYVRSHYSAF